MRDIGQAFIWEGLFEPGDEFGTEELSENIEWYEERVLLFEGRVRHQCDPRNEHVQVGMIPKRPCPCMQYCQGAYFPSQMPGIRRKLVQGADRCMEKDRKKLDLMGAGKIAKLGRKREDGMKVSNTGQCVCPVLFQPSMPLGFMATWTGPVIA